ncbi:MAG: type I DNA topoisomerase [Candidatus Hatepunaea meridiana]|nr:type I DNA topoisomerase [Candidatus Hatepunaea meridiana]
MNTSNKTQKKTGKGQTKTRSNKASKTSPKSSTIISEALVIVESPTKARTLNRYLGKGYNVIASGGHIIDLPPKKLGVDIEADFKPDYKLLPGKARIAKMLTTAASNTKKIFLATDPDREGEAIAWHIQRHIGKKSSDNIWRVQFHEITARAVREALDSPGQIDMQKVDAQQARRVMDRLVGYQVSPVLWKTITGGLSAGRVQSVALRLICERQVEIDAFIPVEYWSIDGKFTGDNVEPFLARLHKFNGKKAEIPNQEKSDEIITQLQSASYHINDISKKRKKRHPYPPYITSTLQQDAGRRLGYTIKRTMSIAQRLYEGLEIGERGQTGLITYMRTDSTRIALEANNSLREWIADNLGSEYVSQKLRVYKNKKGAIQDAHEAIRPTDVKLTPDHVKPYLKPEEYKLYELIWRRFTATQMREAEVDVTIVTITDEPNKIEFRTTGQVIVFPGFLKVYADLKDNGETEGNSKPLPANLIVKIPLELLGLDPKQHFTQPPPRFSEASLVKILDELGIGRPSTYAAIISTLLDRKYVDKEKRNFKPTDLGKTVNKILIQSFPDIFNVEFTAKMEEDLDRIEMGTDWKDVLTDFYTPFSAALKAVEGKRQELKKEALEPVGKQCPECGEDLLYRWGKRGRFISCSGFPKCHYSESIEKTEPVEVTEKCPKCGGEMILREGKFGRFLGCKNYPKCKGVLSISTGHKCPAEGCNGNLVERRSKKGKLFFACDKYPKCKFSSWNPPVDGTCPECGALTIFEKTNKQGSVKYCHNCEWKSGG